MRKPKVRFEIRNDKIKKDGTCPVSCIVSFQQKRKRVDVGISTFSSNWNSKEQKFEYTNPNNFKKQNPDIDRRLNPLQSEIHEWNDSLAAQKKKINDSVRLIELRGQQLNFENIISSFEISEVEKEPELDIPLRITEYIDWYCEKIKNTLKRDSLKVYTQLKMNLLSFEAKVKKRVSFQDLSYEFISDFNDHLVEERNLFNTTIRKQLITLNTLVNKAKKFGLVLNSNYNDFKVKKDDFEVIALHKEEFESLKNLDLSKQPRLDKARDIFIFLCATGFRYSEYAILRRRHISKDEIVLTEVKTGEIRSVFLTTDSRRVLEKYSDLELPLPKISNVKLNKYIKEVGIEAGISAQIEKIRHKGNQRVTIIKSKHELITVHTARKTFITLTLESGIPVETTMAISNHKSYQSFKRYVAIGRDHKKEAMKKAWGE
jgi:integrase